MAGGTDTAGRPYARLSQLLKLLVVLVCLASIVNRVLPLAGYPSLL